MPELRVKNFNIASILADLSQSFNFTVAAGDSLGVTGPSGIGKSIFLKALVDMIPHAGEVFLDDMACQAMPAPLWRRQVSLLPAESQWWAETVGEHFTHFEAGFFNSLGFDEKVMGWQIAHLSSGEKQRLACIRILMNNPKALLLDEPTANLDKENRLKVESVIAVYQSLNQIPIIWISHDQEQLERVSQSVLILSKHHYEIKNCSDKGIA